MKICEKIFFCIVFVFVFIYAGSVTLQIRGLGWLNQLKNLLLICIVGFLYFRNRDNNLKLSNNVKCYLIIMIFLIIMELCMGIIADFVTPVLGLIEFYAVARYADKKFIKFLLASIVIITLISCVPLLTIYLRLGFYARRVMLFEKSMLTFFYGVTYVLFLLAIKYSSQKYKWILITLLIPTFLINVFIMQSKTSVFVFIIVLLIMSINSLRKIPYIVGKYWWLILGFICILSMLPIKYEIPDAMKQATNMITGHTIYQLKSNMRTETYDIRGKIVDCTLETITKNPLTGAGFGNQATVLRTAGLFVSQGESQILDILLDGGLTYLLAFAVLTLPMLYVTGKKMRRKGDHFTDEFVFYQTLGFLILCAGNEMLSSLGWFYLGSLAHVYSSKEAIKVVD